MKTFKEFIIEAGVTPLTNNPTSRIKSIVEVSERGQDLAWKTGQAADRALSRTTDPKKRAALHGLSYASSSRSLGGEYPNTPDMTVNGKPVRKVHDVRRGGTGGGDPDSDRGDRMTRSSPLTPSVRDERRRAAGSSGQGSTPKGPKLFRQNVSNVSVGDDPLAVMRSASISPKPLPKPRGTRGGSSTLPNIGRGVEPTPSGRNFIPGTGENFGISGIKLI